MATTITNTFTTSGTSIMGSGFTAATTSGNTLTGTSIGTYTYPNSSMYAGISNYYTEYVWSKSGKSCLILNEPKYGIFNKGLEFDNEHAAWDHFTERFIQHVNYMIIMSKRFSINKELERNLIKYSVEKGLAGLYRFQETIAKIPIII